MPPPAISVIIPIYNSAVFLKACINSVLQQSLHDIELILVDDGSTDDSLTICQTAAKTDTRIKIYSQKNSGVSAARNKGIKNANGTYITFVDSDDEIHPRALEYLQEAAKSHNTEIAQCDFAINRSSHTQKWPQVEKAKSRIINLKSQNNSFLINYITAGQGSPYVWGKIYLRSHLNNTESTFYSGLGEDYRFNLHVLPRTCKIALIPIELYSYRVRISSLSKNFNPSEFKELSAVTAKKACALCSMGINPNKYRKEISRWHWLNHNRILSKSALAGYTPPLNPKLAISPSFTLSPPSLYIHAIREFTSIYTRIKISAQFKSTLNKTAMHDISVI